MNARQTTQAALAIWFTAVLAVGTAGGFVTPAGRPPLAILLGATLPLVLIPAFFVPLFLLLHVSAFLQVSERSGAAVPA